VSWFSIILRGHGWIKYWNGRVAAIEHALFHHDGGPYVFSKTDMNQARQEMKAPRIYGTAGAVSLLFGAVRIDRTRHEAIDRSPRG
jgi:hypothetical protein